VTVPPALRPILRSLSSFLVALLIAGLASSQSSGSPEASPTVETLFLAPGASLERSIHGGETQSIDLRLDAKTFLLLEIATRGVSLSSRLVSPVGKTIARAEGSRDQLLAVITDHEGTHRLELVAPKEQRVTKRLTVKILALRPAAPEDQARVRGAEALAEGRRLISLNDEEQRSRAEALLTESLTLWQKAGDPRGEVEALLECAELRSKQGDMSGALAWGKRALDLSRESGYAEGEARALGVMGFCNSQLAHHDEANRLLLLSLEILRRVGGPFEQASMLVDLGIAYQKKQDFQAALQTFEEALPLAEASGDPGLKARVLTGVGAGHFLQYRLAKAKEIWEEALELSRQTGDQQLEADLEQNLAAVYQSQGQFQKALDLFTRAVTRTSVKESGMAYYNMGNLFLELGTPQKALENYRLSQRAFQAKGNAEYEANALIGVGWALQRMGEPQAAIAEYEKARGLLPTESWNVIFSIGRAQIDLQKSEEALPSLQRALAMARMNSDRSREAATLLALGSAYAGLGQPEQAVDNLKAAITLGNQIGHHSVVALALLKRSLLRRDQGRLEEALADVENALAVIESTRRNIAGDQLRTGFFAAKRTYYDLDIDLLLQLDKLQPDGGYRAQALETSERARARGLLDLLAEGRIDVRQGLDPDLRQREDDLSDQISRLQSELRAGNAKPERLQELQAERDELDMRREQLEVEIQNKNKRYAEVRYPVPLKLAEIRSRILDDRTALLEYVLGEKSSTLFVITREKIKTFELPASEEIAQQVVRLRRALEQDSLLKRQDYLESAFGLYRDLLKPASATLRGKSNMLIVPDGALYYIPFEALLTEATDLPYRNLPYLLRQYSIAYIPSASVLAGLREPRQEPSSMERKQVVAFAPFASTRKEVLTRGAGQDSYPDSVEGRWIFSPLPASGREAAEIAGLYPGAALSFVGGAADEATVTRNPAVATARRLHFATHAQIDELHPEYSALVLAEKPGEDGLLQMREIFNLKLSADLAVLSACETGLGKEITGEGLMGLTRAFFYAGVPSLVVSLWNVVDGPTPDLMLDFYKNLDRLQNKAKALQTSKLSMITGGTYSHPSYWAPFILLGEPQ
jgi:CHAT domain-containing protein